MPPSAPAAQRTCTAMMPASMLQPPRPRLKLGCISSALISFASSRFADQGPRRRIWVMWSAASGAAQPKTWPAPAGRATQRRGSRVASPPGCVAGPSPASRPSGAPLTGRKRSQAPAGGAQRDLERHHRLPTHPHNGTSRHTAGQQLSPAPRCSGPRPRPAAPATAPGSRTCATRGRCDAPARLHM